LLNIAASVDAKARDRGEVPPGDPSESSSDDH
jgi:hypothetical protein